VFITRLKNLERKELTLRPLLVPVGTANSGIHRKAVMDNHTFAVGMTIIVIAILLVAFYLIILAAVRNGILSAHRQIAKAQPRRTSTAKTTNQDFNIQ
jgi:hypothetical protein